jgi:Spy/CpxP family protein refolding chaperone
MIRPWLVTAAIALLFSPAASWGQAPQQPYAGLETRSIKALSDRQIADLEAGRGMSLALAAELNGYPGPAHVLELAQQLSLNEQQRQRMTELFEAMKREAVPLGEKLIAAERALDRQFASKSVTEASLGKAVENIAAVQGALRTAHLKYHLATLETLTSEQVQRYTELRGYANSPAKPHHHQ